MIVIDIPGDRRLELAHLVLDYNGTLAADGVLLDGVDGALFELSERLAIHVVTADTFGRAAGFLADLPVSLATAPPSGQDLFKRDFVKALGPAHAVAIGNGRNDRLMLREAVLGIALIQAEGASADALRGADIVCPNVLDALALLREPRRLVATLRT